MKAIIDKSTFTFLNQLAKNNHREWFNKKKDQYTLAYDNMLEFVEALLQAMNLHDIIETPSAKKSLWRIYRDTRFSKDKTPYRTHFGGGFKRASKQLRGGYYFQIGPGQSLVAGGFFSPNPQDLLKIRKDIERNYEDWQAMLSNKTIRKTFGQLQGEKVPTVPKGFSKESQGIDLIRHKQFYFEKRFSDEEALSPNFLNTLNKTFKDLRIYFDYMSELLSADENGIPIV